jgi:hypothetical protein
MGSDDDGQAADPSSTQQLPMGGLEPPASLRPTLPQPDDATRPVPSAPAIGEPGARRRDASLPLANWHRYRLLERLGSGGMGEVYKALDPRLNRFVAIKLLRGDDPDFERRFLREAQAQAQIEHPNVCKIFESGNAGNRPYIAMQWIDGLTLQQLAPDLTLEQKVHLIAQAAEGLHAAHRTGLIHRDVKPGNIMAERDADGRLTALVLDFGIAREIAAPGLTRTGLFVGTPNYMSPEQALGKEGEIDRRTDVYALGATMYELLCGRTPFEAASSMEVVLKLLSEEPRPLRQSAPAIPADLESIVMRCIEHDRARRYDSARALAEDLRRFLDGEPVAARPATWTYRLAKRARKHRGLVAAGAAGVLALAALAGVTLRTRAQATEQARLAQSFGQEVAEIQWMLRAASQLPLHDLRPDRERVRQRIRGIEGAMQRIGELARGPGLYALGRAHFELGEVETARARLEASWQAGYRGPAVAVALGRTLGRLYQRAANDADMIPDKRARLARLADLDRDLRQPALGYLSGAGTADTGTEGLALAEAALYRGERDAAIEKARAVRAAAPWLYESAILEGDAYRAEWRQANDRGDWPAADAARLAAEAAYRAGALVGASDPRPYLDLCEIAMRDLSTRFFSRGEGSVADLEPGFLTGLADCEKALTADPGSARAWTAAGEAHSRWGEILALRNGDPGPELAKAEAAVRRATEADARYAPAWASLGSLLGVRANRERESGGDPTASIDAAIAAFERSIALDPRDTFTLNGLGIVHTERGLDALYSGKDPREPLRGAVAALAKAIELDPTDVNPRINFGNAKAFIGGYEASHGLDARPALAEAAASFEKALEINPGLGIALNGLGVSRFQQGHETLQRGLDPREELRLSEATYLESLELAPGEPFTKFNLAQVYGDLGEYERRSGRDPAKLVEQGVALFRDAFRANSSMAGPFVDCGLVHLVAARYDADIGRDPARPLGEIHGLVARALAVDPKKSSAHRLQGEAALVEARYKIALGKQAAPELARAAAALTRATGFNELDSEAFAALAETELLRFQAGDKSAAERGPQAAAKALELHPGLARATAASEAWKAVQGPVR